MPRWIATTPGYPHDRPVSRNNPMRDTGGAPPVRLLESHKVRIGCVGLGDPMEEGEAPLVSLTIYVEIASKCSMATADSPTDTAPVEDARDELQDAIPEAARTLADLLDADDERVQIRAAEAILDRAGLTKAKGYSRTKAQVQIGGGEQSGAGFTKTDPLEDGDDAGAPDLF